MTAGKKPTSKIFPIYVQEVSLKKKKKKIFGDGKQGKGKHLSNRGRESGIKGEKRGSGSRKPLGALIYGRFETSICERNSSKLPRGPIHLQETNPHSSISFSTMYVGCDHDSLVLESAIAFSRMPVLPALRSRGCGTAGFFGGSPTLGSHSEQAPGFRTSGGPAGRGLGIAKANKSSR